MDYYYANTVADGKVVTEPHSPLFDPSEVSAFEQFLDGIAIDNSHLFHPRVPSTLSWSGYSQSKSQFRDELQREGLKFGSDPRFGRHGYIPPPIPYISNAFSETSAGFGNSETVQPFGSTPPMLSTPQGSVSPSTEDTPRQGSPTMQSLHPSLYSCGVRGGSLPAGSSNQFSQDSAFSYTKDTRKQISKGSARSKLEPSDPSVSGKKETLTSAQKRLNHITSEQKRRNLIRSGFADLASLVPCLKGGNDSKSVVLDRSVEYIQEVKSSNAQLRHRIATLQLQLGR